MAVIAWFRVNKRRGRPDTIHAPWPSAAACELYRAVAISPAELGGHVVARRFELPMRDLTFGSEVRKASDKPSDNGPG